MVVLPRHPEPDTVEVAVPTAAANHTADLWADDGWRPTEEWHEVQRWILRGQQHHDEAPDYHIFRRATFVGQSTPAVRAGAEDLPNPFRVVDDGSAARDDELAIEDFIEWTDSEEDGALAAAIVPPATGAAASPGDRAEAAAAAEQLLPAADEVDEEDSAEEDAALAAVVLPAAPPAPRYIVLQGGGAAPRPMMPARIHAAWAMQRARRRAAEAQWADFVATGALARGAQWQWATLLPGQRP